MRIIAGYLKGRNIQSPKKYATHPMSEKMRGALFNVLGDISGLSVLDAYAGSGAVGIEAISRGATSVVACDIDKDAVRIIKQNVTSLGLEQHITVAHANCLSYLENQSQLFDIIICDPPYNDVKTSQLIKLSEYALPSGLVVLSLPTNYLGLQIDGFHLVSLKKYGGANLFFLKHTS